MNLEHKKRWIAALVGISFFATLYYFLQHWAVVFASVLISWAAYWEFLTFSGATKTLRFTSSLMGLFLSLWLCLQLPGALPAVYFAALVIILRCLWQAHTQAPELITQNFQYAQSRFFGLVYLVVFPSFFAKVHALPHGPQWVLLLLLLIWFGDTAGYYGGKTWGKTKLSPNVSPGKTVEGAVSSLALCLVLALIFRHFTLTHLAYWKIPLIVLSTSIIAQAGDLVESLMKRAYQVKDSSGWIPGHGGVFDRFDSLILAGPFYYCLIRTLG